MGWGTADGSPEPLALFDKGRFVQYSETGSHRQISSTKPLCVRVDSLKAYWYKILHRGCFRDFSKGEHKSKTQLHVRLTLPTVTQHNRSVSRITSIVKRDQDQSDHPTHKEPDQNPPDLNRRYPPDDPASLYVVGRWGKVVLGY
jgi:hypothetical protein